MKVLILSCSTGGGHDACAKALKEGFDNLNIYSEIINHINLTNKDFASKVDQVYIDIVTKNPNLFKGIYSIGEAYSKLKIKSPVYAVNSLFSNKLYEYITENKFDICLCSHLYPAETLTNIKKEHQDIHFINVTTDYVSIPFWEETNPDYFVLGSNDLVNSFLNKGIPKEKLLTIGIPTSLKFNNKFGYLDACQKLNIPAGKRNILIMSGSMGFGNIDNSIKTILNSFEDINIIVMCGHNDKLKERLETTFKNIYVFGFRTDINLFMDASSVILTKPGGLTSTETAVNNIPTIFTSPIPGCEDYNARFFKERNMALIANNDEEIISSLKVLLNDNDFVEKMKENQNKYINKQASLDICNFVIKNYETKKN